MSNHCAACDEFDNLREEIERLEGENTVAWDRAMSLSTTCDALRRELEEARAELANVTNEEARQYLLNECWRRDYEALEKLQEEARGLLKLWESVWHPGNNTGALNKTRDFLSRTAPVSEKEGGE